MIKKILEINGAKSLNKKELKLITGGLGLGPSCEASGGTSIWTVHCDDGNDVNLNPDGAYSPAEIVGFCGGVGNYSHQSTGCVHQ